MSARVRPISSSLNAAIHPCSEIGVCRNQLRIACMTRTSAIRVMMISAPGPSSLASAAISRSDECIHSVVSASRVSSWISGGSTPVSFLNATGANRRILPTLLPNACQGK